MHPKILTVDASYQSMAAIAVQSTESSEMDANPATRGQRLNACRTQIGWSQLDVARYLGISQTMVSFAEKDLERVPKIFWYGFEAFCEKVENESLRAEDKHRNSITQG